MSCYITQGYNSIANAIDSEKTRLRHCVSALFPNAGNIDRLQKARQHGCNVASAPTLDGLIQILNKWGADGSQARRTIEQYDQVVRRGNTGISLSAPAGRTGTPPVPLVDGEGPFFAMEVQPSSVPCLFTAKSRTNTNFSITFTYGGIAIDTRAHAITADKKPIPGLLVAGVDAGGFSNLGYAGGLALAFVTGIWAARAIAQELNLLMPQLPAANAKDIQPAEGARL